MERLHVDHGAKPERSKTKKTPSEDDTKAEIQAWLDAKGIEWTTAMTKAELLDLADGS